MMCSTKRWAVTKVADDKQSQGLTATACICRMPHRMDRKAALLNQKPFGRFRGEEQFPVASRTCGGFL
jgi:hypothetical protein